MVSLLEKMCTAAARSMLTVFDTPSTSIPDAFKLNDNDLLLLSTLTLNQQRYLIDHAIHFLDVNINTTAFQKKLKEIEDMSETREIEDRYLLLGSPLILMRRLFGMHASEFSRRRRLLNIAGSGTGRPSECDEQTDHLIWKQWQAHDNIDERQRYLAIADATDIDLHAIWSSLRDYIDN